ncbi:TIGR01777 family protein [Ornithinimicrobium ciconiae]|uniref:TIGR01777 family protein n=1 Tax=Ornithinimicrobium ciconiae TaxID=2594265 RepID=A0A516GA18_9MICO|nr:TIGR01777 family oxidoreductase [Ornithinimicrobium ciconiae]QDO88369.1 TIGR01777 family protein [Ornithinimicrobium ciconiae]
MTTEPSSPDHLVAITGSSGLLGSALSQALRQRGDEVIHLVRRDPGNQLPQGVTEVRWDPKTGLADGAALDRVTAVVNLAGAGLGDRRWTDRYKNELVESRVINTNTLSAILARLPQRPRLVSGSAIGFYGTRGDVELTEQSTAGTGFVPGLVSDWEHSTWAAEEAGLPVAHIRSGIVFSRKGGALARLLPLVRAGLAGKMGSGRQFWSWITLPDHIAAMIWLIDHPEVTGPVNLTAPTPAPQTEVVTALADMLHRPSLIPAPTIALRLALGEMASEVLGSQRVLPTVLQEYGFTFTHPDLQSAAAWVTATTD